MTIQLDIPTAADAGALAQVGREVFTETFRHLYHPEDLATFLQSTFGGSGLPAQIDDPAYEIRVHREGGAITGFAKLGPNVLPADAPPGSLELYQLYVRAAWHGRGIAQALMDWAIAEARSRGAPALLLTVYVDNHRAKRFYARYGFVEIGRYAFSVGNQLDDDRIWMLML